MPAPRPRLIRFLIQFALLALFGILPLAARELTAGSRDGASPGWPVLEAEARGRAAAIDATIERWLPSARERAQEIAAVLAQLPAGPFGKAAEGTLLLHLERRLAADPEMDRFLVLAPDGKVLLAVGKRGPPAGDALPEVAQAAQRPAAALVRPHSGGRAALVVAAPFQRGEALGGLFVARVRAETLARGLAPVGDLQPNLVDAAGVVLLPAGEGGLPPSSIGLESRAGRATTSTGAPVAYVPLQGARAVLAVTGVAGGEGQSELYPIAAAVLLAAMVVALLFAWRGREADRS